MIVCLKNILFDLESLKIYLKTESFKIKFTNNTIVALFWGNVKHDTKIVRMIQMATNNNKYENMGSPEDLAGEPNLN